MKIFEKLLVSTSKQWEVIVAEIQKNDVANTETWKLAILLPIKPGTLTKTNKERLHDAGWFVFVTPDQNYILYPLIVVCFDFLDIL